MKAMLEKLLGRENISPKPKDNPHVVAPEKPSFDQLELTEAAIIKRYPYSAFSKMLPDIADHPVYGAKLLNTLIGHQALFERYIRHFKQLKQLIDLCPIQINTIMNNLMEFSDSRETFSTFFITTSSLPIITLLTKKPLLILSSAMRKSENAGLVAN